MSIKSIQLGFRVTPAEARAVKGFARAKNTTFAELVRTRVVNAAVSYDPKQTEMVLVPPKPEASKSQAPVAGTSKQRWAWVRKETARLQREERRARATG
jgi:hypothetical protein